MLDGKKLVEFAEKHAPVDVQRVMLSALSLRMRHAVQKAKDDLNVTAVKTLTAAGELVIGERTLFSFKSDVKTGPAKSYSHKAKITFVKGTDKMFQDLVIGWSNSNGAMLSSSPDGLKTVFAMSKENVELLISKTKQSDAVTVEFIA
jgi:hypothetical protein